MRYALRQLVKSPGFTAVALLTLALALGVNSAVFALVNAAVLRPVVPRRPDEVVNLFNGRQASDRDFRPFSFAEYRALRNAHDTFADVAATASTTAGIEGNQGVQRSLAFFTSENYFSLLGVQPAIGRFYNADECRPNAAAPVVVASYALWQREGGQPDFVGRTLRINGQPYAVIGVTPRGFNGVSAFMAFDIWAPLGLISTFNTTANGDLADDETHLLNLTARLAPGVTSSSLPSRLPALGQLLTKLASNRSGDIRELAFETPNRHGVSSGPSGKDSAVPISLGVLAMSACVLVIASLNLANLLLARGSQREKEISIRLALGADRWRIVRQLLAEGLVLAVVGGALGLILAVWGNDLLLRSFSAVVSLNGASTSFDPQPDAVVLGVTFLLCLAATLVFSLGPALKASRIDLIQVMKQSGSEARNAGGFQRFFSVRHCLVMAQIALSLMLLFGAALFFRSALKAANVVPGFDPAGVLVADLDYSLSPLKPDEAKRSVFASLDHLAAQPGVRFAAAANFVPYSSRLESRDVQSARAPVAPGTRGPNAVFAAVTAGYFDALGVRLLQGRTFTPAEARASGPLHVAIIDEELAKQLFPDGNALGERLRLDADEPEIVGICAAHRNSNRTAGLPAHVFIPYGGGHDGRLFALIRFANGAPAAAAAIAPLRAAMRTFDPHLPLFQLTPFPYLIEQDFTAWMARLGAMLFGFFGLIALLLAVVGIYGVKAYAVTCRTREIGIRMAIGAQPRDVFALLLKQGALQILVAVTAGFLLALAAGQILAKMLYEVTAADPVALLLSATALSTAALLACYLPARRATKIDPMTALRAE